MGQTVMQSSASQSDKYFILIGNVSGRMEWVVSRIPIDGRRSDTVEM